MGLASHSSPPMQAPDTAAELLRLYGTTQPIPQTVSLQAGALCCVLEDGAIRTLRWHGVEVIRGIAYLLRDSNWGTSQTEVTDLSVQQDPQSFVVHFHMRMTLRDGVLHASARVQGHADGRFVFEVDATPDVALRTNRCGFVVLHPAQVAGAPLDVEHTDGSTQHQEFPRWISPGQVAYNIRRLRHRPQPGLVVDCLLQAQLPHDPLGKFEMEDQRNWSDGSFKTYVASLLDPWPYTLDAGVRLNQVVQVRMESEPGLARDACSATPLVPAALAVGASLEVRMPAIGVGVPQGLEHMRAQELACVVALKPGWLVAEVEVTDAQLLARLVAIAHLAQACGARVQLDALCPGTHTPENDAHRLAQACSAAGLVPHAMRAGPQPYLASYQPSDQWPDIASLERYAQAYAECFPSAQVGGGMLTYFTELNRKRQSDQHLHFIGHSTCPLVHAADDLSVMQTLEALPSIVASVKQLWPHLEYRLGPVTLGMQRNPYGSSVAQNPHRVRMPMATDDPRHHAQFGAAWLAGYAAAVAPLGLGVLSFQHTHGLCGPLRLSTSGVQDGGHTTAWAVQAALAQAAGNPVLAVHGVPDGVQALAWQAEQKHLMLVNLTPAQTTVVLDRPWRGAGNVGASEGAPDSLAADHRCRLDAYQVLILTS